MIYKRSILNQINANLDNDYILVIIGARQTGKTTILRKIFQEIENNKRSFFINLEKLDYVSLLNESPENIFKIIPPPDKEISHIFIDEIQYLHNPTNFLKYLYDEYKGKIKLIVSGSSAFYIDRKFKDSLAGRKRIFILYTLSFKEFLIFKQRDHLLQFLFDEFDIRNFDNLFSFPQIYKDELLVLFSEYSRYGGYPGVVLAESEEEKKIILEDLINSSVKKDIYESNLKYPEKYYSILKILAGQTGQLLNRHELSKTLQISLTAADNYLYVMQKSFQIAQVTAFHSNTRKEIIKMPKQYFFDMGMRNCLLNDFRDISLRVDKGFFLENLVFKQFLDKYPADEIKFWRTQDKNELDFVIDKKYGFEVKANPESFSISKYKSFKDRYPGISVDVICYDGFEKKDGYNIWGVWGI